MNMPQVRNTVAGVAAAMLLTLLFVQQRPPDAQQHDRFTHNLQSIKQLDAEITRDVLSSRYDLLNSYDPFVTKFEAMRGIGEELKQIPTFIGGPARARIESFVNTDSEIMAKKARLIETFKSRSAILKNSLQYFPALVDDTFLEAGRMNNRPVQQHLANLLREILLDNITRRNDLDETLKAEMDTLGRDAARYPNIAPSLSRVLAHAANIVSVKPQVDGVTEELIDLPTAMNINAISAAYSGAYDRALKVNDNYRLFLYICAVLLLGYAANRTISLVRSRAVVERANRELHDANAQLLQAQTELQLTNDTIELVMELRSAELEKEITDKRVLEGQLVQAQKLESIGQLAAGIAHEINTPIQYIGDNIRFLKDAFASLKTLMAEFLQFTADAGELPELRERAADIRSECENQDLEYLLEEIPNAVAQSLEGVVRVGTIVLAMKEFSHPGSNEKELIDINHSIESTLTVCRNEWKYVADVETKLDPTLPLISCLGGEMNQVILNLVVNAAHAISEAKQDSRERGLITVSTSHSGAWAEVRIKDNGTGIPEAVQSRIFTPFFTTKEVGKGTGQGLCLARTVVVKKHGGTLTFETTEGEGTTFIVRLPLSGAALEKVA